MYKDSSARYYEKRQRNNSKNSHERYQNLSQEEENREREYGHERCKNLLETER